MTMGGRAISLLVGMLLLATRWTAAAARDDWPLEPTPPPSRCVSLDGTPNARHALPHHSAPLVVRPLAGPSPSRSVGTLDLPSQGRVCLVVADATYEGIASALDVHRQDLEAEGYEVVSFELVSGTAESLRGLLMELYEEPASLVGAVFIGDVPYVIYELMQSFADEPPHYEDFPCDLYFMDLDGVWQDVVEDGRVHSGNGKYDLHTGEVGLEIWVCRIDAGNLPNLGVEADVLRNYFEKNHLYGIGEMPVERRALVYLDDDFAHMADGDRDAIARVYSEAAVEVVDEPEMTTRSDYLTRLATQGYELIHTRCHGSPHIQQYARADGHIRENVTPNDYVLYDPRVLFYSFCVCKAADYTVESYLVGTAVFSHSWGLFAWGTTKTGGMYHDGPFYESLASGASFGEALLTWYQYVRQRYAPSWVQKWWYGTVLIGDATLSHRVFPDVGRTCWAAREIRACADMGIVTGYEDGAYRPLADVSRDQMAVYISRAVAGGDEHVPPGPSEPTFGDVDTDHWAFDCIEYAAENGIVQGHQDGSYRPSLTVDRGQMAVYVARSICDPTGEEGLAGYVPADPRNFPDVASDFWSYKHVEYCVENGVVAGYLDGLYHPEIVVTRDQMAVYVARAFGLAS
jgi:hypothetical protein